MDPIAVLQRRIEQLESKLGLCPSLHDDEPRHEMPNVVDQLHQANNFINSAMSGHEKLTEAAKRATELNNYADPNFVQNAYPQMMYNQYLQAPVGFPVPAQHQEYPVPQRAPINNFTIPSPAMPQPNFYNNYHLVPAQDFQPATLMDPKYVAATPIITPNSPRVPEGEQIVYPAIVETNYETSCAAQNVMQPPIPLISPQTPRTDETLKDEKVTETLPTPKPDPIIAPNIKNLQHSDMKAQEIVDSEPIIRHHCQCMHRCQKAAPALESEAVQQVPAMQETLDKMLGHAAHLKDQSDKVSGGVQQVAETCGHAANHASHQLTKLAENIDKLESKAVRRRRNGLD